MPINKPAKLLAKLLEQTKADAKRIKELSANERIVVSVSDHDVEDSATLARHGVPTILAIKDVQTGLVWATKILTDPFHDIKLYHKAPFALLRGELIAGFNSILGNGAVQELYFTEFAIQ